ncbi:hypothetical protein A3C21_00730 [Candidatus Kaiserbacteria bacterium RIFCSPHIGHO2_02_FULL_59_21]|uniref:PPC domain-containing protein n=2 Tax=Candidatus Kaiseribacteriota TaxID=1752734 RepID=A0A0G1YXQ8_9BACT|nr:MAG: hypothetical protein UY98_C0001G0007 [Candidatus Kaiserbacteria bacterium GW2011_GWA2_58_9]OGG62002.1 MAG: hypothetical protein A2766_02230 [Candidatus Kaiserbacteria bacterium RIFCSPHIGHO2_01_FULL_58_22]OGG67232.1 MAG: hypothetical protein A3C21_00730 [Candidatus Kaiserbacteria bacterium RIFCSPHIGHO2_02_FULL_59_21]OGG79873.1 MAG: hypothetical protein A2952_02420 [Candidatus Kaiserbacteria bacterium RIFCSPLOWO2_01_FULL_59_34]OGG86513.1 MAG: hypothetical protein A3I47_00955 [Candidatus K
MQAVQIHNGTFLVLERGEEFFSSVSRYCEEHQIHWAQFQAIGAVEDVEIGYYDLPTREYVFRAEEGPLEVASMDGNVAELNGLPVLHAHAVLSRCDETLECIGGHLRRAIVAVTLEVAMWEITQPLIRRFDDDIGLNLITVAV